LNALFLAGYLVRLEAKAKQMVGAVKHVLQRRKDLAALETELRQYVELVSDSPY
jgi:hypothetical protein